MAGVPDGAGGRGRLPSADRGPGRPARRGPTARHGRPSATGGAADRAGGGDGAGGHLLLEPVQPGEQRAEIGGHRVGGELHGGDVEQHPRVGRMAHLD